MLRHITFAIVSLAACGVASAQYPYSPYPNYGGTNSRLNCANGFCGTPSANCPNGNCATGPTICGPNGCYTPGTAPGSYHPYQQQYSSPSNWMRPNLSWPYRGPTSNYRTMPAYPVPSSSYNGFPNIPSGYRSHSPVNYYPSTGEANPYDSYGGPGVLH